MTRISFISALASSLLAATPVPGDVLGDGNPGAGPNASPNANPGPDSGPDPDADPGPDPAVLAISGDPEYGEYLASECVTCHQASGADDGIPSITGWPRDEFVAAMLAYKTRARPHPIMQMMAGRLSDEEIASLAAFFEGVD